MKFLEHWWPTLLMVVIVGLFFVGLAKGCAEESACPHRRCGQGSPVMIAGVCICAELAR